MPTPELNREQKAELLLQLVEFFENTEKLHHTQSAISVFRLIRYIYSGGQLPATSGQAFIQELRKNRLLWTGIRPFLRNCNDGCGNKACGHTPEQHESGICVSVNYGSRIPNTYEYTKIPCVCTSYIDRRKW